MAERDDGEEYSIIFPLHISKVVASDDRHAITLFYNSNEEASHYSLITPRKYIWLQFLFVHMYCLYVNQFFSNYKIFIYFYAL